jgi:hypothetical protein
MLANELYAKLAPFATMVNKHALSPSYRALRVEPTVVRAVSMFGLMEAEVPSGIPQPVDLDGEEFLQLLRSLPSQELKLALSDNVVTWECGAAKGRIATMGDVNVPALTWPDNPGLREMPTNFSRGLDSASLVGSSIALQSVGLYGAVFYNDAGGLVAYSSDNPTIGSIRFSDTIEGSAERMTLSPDAIRVLEGLAKTGRLALSFDAETVYCQTPVVRLVLKQSPPLKFDLRGMISGFRESNVRVELNREIVAAFIHRTEALVQERSAAVVSLEVRQGNVCLAFTDLRAASEEYYLAKSPVEVDVVPIRVDTRRISRALQHAQSFVFDYVEKGVLVMRGEDEFLFVVSQRTEN